MSTERNAQDVQVIFGLIKDLTEKLHRHEVGCEQRGKESHADLKVVKTKLSLIVWVGGIVGAVLLTAAIKSLIPA